MFQLGHFVLASGDRSNWKIECDTLTNDDWAALAWMLIEQLAEPFREVLGVPRGGVRFATALRQHTSADSNRLLIVDDVWTTGSSMKTFVKNVRSDRSYDTQSIDRAVVFAREPAPAAVTALFRMSVWP